MARAPLSYVAKANAYIRDVLSGKIPACQFVKQACKRQRDDLSRQSSRAWRFRFDEDKANRICRYVERLPHIKGPKARKRESIQLEGWQCFVYSTVFGWVHKSGDKEGLRRFRSAYLEVPKGNSKSTMLSGVGLYMLTADGEEGAEVYSAATSSKQARIVFDDARNMALRRPKMIRRFGITIGSRAISVPKTAGTFQPLSSAADQVIEGSSPHCAVIDELHAHKSRKVYDNMETALGKRDQSLMFVITTAGDNKMGVCYEVRADVIKVLSGAAKDETIFGVIYTIDLGKQTDDGEPGENGDDPFSEMAMRKANPNYRVSVDPDHLKRMAAKAQRSVPERAKYLTKHLNIWINSYQSAFDMERWVSLGDASLSPDQFLKDDAWMHLDLASHTDMVARVKLYRRMKQRVHEGKPVMGDDGKPLMVPHFYVFADNYIPRLAFEEATNPNYPAWEEERWLAVTDGNSTDFALVKRETLEDARRQRFRAIGYDPYQAGQLGQELMSLGLPAIEMAQTVLNLSEPTKRLMGIILDGDISHSGNPVLQDHLANVVVKYDAKDNVFPRKESADRKIDSGVALINAMAMAMSNVNAIDYNQLARSGTAIM